MAESDPDGPQFDYFKTRETVHKDLHILRVADIKPILAQWRITRSGSKQELIDRLLKNMDEKHQTADRNKLVKHIQDEVYRLKSGWGMIPPRAVAARPATPVGNQYGQPSMSGAIGNLPGTVGAGGLQTAQQCICQGHPAVPMVEKACINCKGKFHPSCFGLTYPFSRDYCFLCISKLQDPFYEVHSTLCGPVRSLAGTNTLTLQFKLTAREQSDAFRIDSSGVRNMRILVRCFALASQDQTRRAGQKVSKFPPHCWPLESLVRLNTTVPVNIKQRHVFWQNQYRKWKGVSDPVDIFPLLRVGNNRLSIIHKDDKQYVAFVQIVRRVPPEELTKRVVSSTTNPSVEEGLRRVKESFRGKGGLADEDDDDDDEDLMATVTRISVRCPVGLVPIDMPAKGRHCNHLQCFDLGTFLRFNEKNTTASWKCGVCNNPLTIDDLEVDNFMLDIVRKLSEAKKEGRVSEDVDTVEIDSDGTWKPHTQTLGGDRKRKAEEPAAPQAGTANGEAMGEAAAQGGTARDADIIVMDDDDDDEVRPPPSKAPRQDPFLPPPPPHQPGVNLAGTIAFHNMAGLGTQDMAGALQRLMAQNPQIPRPPLPPAPAPARVSSSSSSGGGGAGVIDLTLSDSDDDEGGGLRMESSSEEDEDDEEGPMRRSFRTIGKGQHSTSASDDGDDDSMPSYENNNYEFYNSDSGGGGSRDGESFITQLVNMANDAARTNLLNHANATANASASAAASSSTTPAPVAPSPLQGMMAQALANNPPAATSATSLPTNPTMTFAPSTIQLGGYTLPGSHQAMNGMNPPPLPTAPTGNTGMYPTPTASTGLPSNTFAPASPAGQTNLQVWSTNANPYSTGAVRLVLPVRPATTPAEGASQGPIRLVLPVRPAPPPEGASQASSPPVIPLGAAYPQTAPPHLGNPTQPMAGRLPQTMYQQGGSASHP